MRDGDTVAFVEVKSDPAPLMERREKRVTYRQATNRS